MFQQPYYQSTCCLWLIQWSQYMWSPGCLCGFQRPWATACWPFQYAVSYFRLHFISSWISTMTLSDWGWHSLTCHVDSPCQFTLRSHKTLNLHIWSFTSKHLKWINGLISAMWHLFVTNMREKQSLQLDNLSTVNYGNLLLRLSAFAFSLAFVLKSKTGICNIDIFLFLQGHMLH